MSIEIFLDSEFSGGGSGEINQDAAYVGDVWNDKISSIKVCSGTWEFFEDANFQGNSFRLTPGNYSYVTNSWNDKISSFRQVGQDDQSAPPSGSSSSGGMAQELLNAHNSYRSQVGAPPLTWSDNLANQAKEWANHLSSTGKFEHSSGTQQGENLWKGTSNHFSYTQMVDRWGDEKKNFNGGVSPNFSHTGNFGDVGHYTQMVWKNTTQVGCAVVDGNGNAVLVCRYDPSGNVAGQRPF